MLKPSLQLRIGTQLTMTPQLQQAIKLLQLPSLELLAHVRELLESNVMLEAEEDDLATTATLPALPEEAASASASAAEPRGGGDDTPQVEVVDDGWEPAFSASGDAGWGEEDEDRRLELQDTRGDTLREHLLWQVDFMHLAPRELAIAQAIVDAINDDGYISDPLDAIAATLKPEIQAEPAEIERLLPRIQSLDPLGVAARSVSECLQLQLAALDADTPGRDAALAIAADHLDLVARRDLAALRRALHLDAGQVEQALALVRGCHPRPGAQISPAVAEYVVPDLFVRRNDDGGWAIEMNPATLPRVRVNQGYADMLGRAGGHAGMRTQLQEARWLVRSLEMRHDTMLKVAHAIVERQLAFLEHGEEHMKPMILRDIAQVIQMHESTVSRVTSGKYIHTPRGVFELRYFFSSQVEGADGSGTSSTAIRARIRKLIQEEPPATPLSDNRIAELLSEEGIPVARRTVAKYREGMGIAPSSERKRAQAR